MIQVIKICTNAIMDKSDDKVMIGYHVATIRTMTRGLAHWGQDLGMNITVYDDKLPNPSKKDPSEQYIE